MIENFNGDSADIVWQIVADQFRNIEHDNYQPSRAGDTIELMHVGMSINNPRERWVISRHPALNPAFALAEIVWILNGRNDSEFLNYWNRNLAIYAGKEDQYHGAYGHRLRKNQGLDQIQRAYQALKNNPHGRQIVLQIWDSEIDLPHENGQPVNPDIPCNIVSLLKIRSGKLEWLQLMRSNDFFLGLPHNFIQFTLLQELFAGWLSLELGSYNHISDSLHVYKKDIKKLLKSLPTERRPNTDCFNISYDESEILFSDLSNRMDKFKAEKLTKSSHATLSEWDSAPNCFKNMLCIIGSEAARRRRWFKLADEIMEQCTNPIYLQLWSNWKNRFKK